MVVGYCLGCCASALCCAGNSCCLSCFTRCGVQPKSLARLGYVLLQLICVMIAFVLMFTLKPIQDSADWGFCNEYTGQKEGDEVSSACFGVSAVLRMTFALACFHVLIILVILPRGQCSAVIHDSGWCLKFYIIVALFIGFFWIPISFFQAWADISRYVSILFLVVQVFYILDGAYSFNDYMANRPTNDDNWKFGVLLFYTIVLIAGSFLILVGSFFWFIGVKDENGERPDCSTNLIIIIVTIAMYALIFMLWKRKDSSIFTCSLVGLWITYLMWSALASLPGEECNALANSGGATFIQIISHVLWTFVTLFSFSTATTSSSEEVGQNNVAKMVAEDDEAKDVEDIEVQVSPNEETVKGEEVYIFPVSIQTIFFQLILIIVCCHYSMILTNWGDPVVNNDKSSFFARTYSTFWIKIAM